MPCILIKSTQNIPQKDYTKNEEKEKSKLNEKYDDRVEKIEQEKDNRLEDLEKLSSAREKELVDLTIEELAEEMTKIIEKSIMDHS